MEENKQNKDSSEEVYCPVSKHKIHCSQIEGTEASELSEERRYEFCLNKCPIYPVRELRSLTGFTKDIKAILTKMEQVEIVYQDRLLKISKCPAEKGTKYKIEMTDGRIRRSREEYFNSDKEAIENARQEFRDLCK